jgi:hypothetical protein
MKFLILMLSLFVSSVFAQTLPAERSPCNWGSSCIDYEGLDTVFARVASVLNTAGVTNQRYNGTYYQRATGENCQQAVKAAKDKMLFNHPEMSCDGNYDGVKDEIYCGATNHGPELLSESCMRSSKGEIVAWIKCDNTNRSSKPRSAKAQRDAFMFYLIMKKDDAQSRVQANRYRP